MDYPITGSFKSKRGMWWTYHVSKSGYVEQWREVTVKKSTGGYRSKSIYTNPTKECKEHIEEKYGIKCK